MFAAASAEGLFTLGSGLSFATRVENTPLFSIPYPRRALWETHVPGFASVSMNDSFVSIPLDMGSIMSSAPPFSETLSKKKEGQNAVRRRSTSRTEELGGRSHTNAGRQS
jgi:hypothetical protein